MPKTKKKKVDRYQKQKMAAIPVLLLVLGFVLWSNFQGDKPAKPKPSPQQIATKPATAKNSKKTPDWPQTGIEFLSGPNPFASYRVLEQELVDIEDVSPHETKKLTPEEPLIEQVGRQLAQLPLRYMFKSDGKWVMMLGDRLITEGEEVADAIRVEKIEQGRMILKQRPSSPTSSLIQ